MITCQNPYLPELNARIKALIDAIILMELIIGLMKSPISRRKESIDQQRSINLTSKEFDLLVYFIANKNRVIQKMHW
jgi:DNA-binding response OmpR family regulator